MIIWKIRNLENHKSRKVEKLKRDFSGDFGSLCMTLSLDFDNTLILFGFYGGQQQQQLQKIFWIKDYAGRGHHLSFWGQYHFVKDWTLW